VRKLSVNETQALYLQELTKRANLPAASIPVIEEIRQSQERLETAIEGLRGNWPTIHAHIERARVAKSKLVSKEHQIIQNEWIAKKDTEYLVSQVPMADIQHALVTLVALEELTHDFARMVPPGSVVEEPGSTTGVLREAVKVTETFLAGGEGRQPVRKVAEALEAVVRSNVRPQLTDQTKGAVPTDKV